LTRRLQADLALVFCALVWGIAFVLVQDALNDASVFVFMFVRFGVATLLMGGIFWKDIRDLSGSEIRVGCQVGALMFGGFAFQTAGLLTTTPSNAAFITGFGVVLIPILMAIFWRHRINPWVWAGVLVSLVGLYYLTVPPSGIAGLHRGDILVLVCAVLFSFQIIYIANVTSRFSPGSFAFLQVAATAVLSLPGVGLAWAAGLEAPRWQTTSRLLLAVLITSVLSTAVAISIQAWAQQHTTPTHTALILTLEPVFAAITSYLVLGERLGARALVGAACILIGILLAELMGAVQFSVVSE
jgi:drug/metabolite transporter (DMT)-like permease